MKHGLSDVDNMQKQTKYKKRKWQRLDFTVTEVVY